MVVGELPTFDITTTSQNILGPVNHVKKSVVDNIGH
jgi:hypothetical protein